MTEAYPKLRALDIQPFRQDGQAMLLLRDPLGLTDQMLAIPQPLAPLLGLCDGTRDLVGIHTALECALGHSHLPTDAQPGGGGAGGGVPARQRAHSDGNA